VIDQGRGAERGYLNKDPGHPDVVGQVCRRERAKQDYHCCIIDSPLTGNIPVLIKVDITVIKNRNAYNAEYYQKNNTQRIRRKVYQFRFAFLIIHINGEGPLHDHKGPNQEITQSSIP
jgi:hypothetical protein